MINIPQHIKNVCKRKMILPMIIAALMTMILILCPFLNIFHPTELKSIFESNHSSKYVSITADSLYYTGYNLIRTGHSDYGYYYALKDNQCVFVLLPIDNNPKTVLYNYSFCAKRISSNNSYRQMLSAFAKDLNWNDKDLLSVSGNYILSTADYHPYLYAFLLWWVLLVLFLSLKKIATSLIGFFQPDMYPVCTFLGRDIQKDLIEEAGAELDSQNYLQINSMYITENYFIDLGKKQVSIIPLQEIVWCYRLGTIPLNPHIHKPEYSIYFTLLNGSVVPVKHKTSDEALELINSIRATEYDIIIGHSDSKRKRAKKIIQKYKKEENY